MVNKKENVPVFFHLSGRRTKSEQSRPKCTQKMINLVDFSHPSQHPLTIGTAFTSDFFWQVNKNIKLASF